jgi:hypothetical protein
MWISLNPHLPDSTIKVSEKHNKLTPNEELKARIKEWREAKAALPAPPPVSQEAPPTPDVVEVAVEEEADPAAEADPEAAGA